MIMNGQTTQNILKTPSVFMDDNLKTMKDINNHTWKKDKEFIYKLLAADKYDDIDQTRSDNQHDDTGENHSINLRGFIEEVPPTDMRNTIREIRTIIRRLEKGRQTKFLSRLRAVVRNEERMMRWMDLLIPTSEEDISSNLRWFYEQRSPKDLPVLRHVRLTIPNISPSYASFISTIVTRILSRAAHLEWLNPWMAACAVGVEISEEQKADLLDEILKASEDQAARLMELAEARGCQSIYRRAAVWRLFQVSKNIPTLWFLRVLFDPEEPDEELRISAYKTYLSLREVLGLPQDQDELNEEKQHMLTDPSPRMRWLFSLGH